MKNQTEREILAGLLAKVRRRLFFKTAFHGLMLSALAAFDRTITLQSRLETRGRSTAP